MRAQKSYWTIEEDRRLGELVAAHGPTSWSLIAKLIEGRSGKQCRERWMNHLCPNVCKSPFSAEEDAKILDLVDRYGTSWAKIARHFGGGRTDNAIKNRYNSSLKRTHLMHKLPSQTVPYTVQQRPMDDVASVPASPEHYKEPFELDAPAMVVHPAYSNHNVHYLHDQKQHRQGKTLPDMMWVNQNPKSTFPRSSFRPERSRKHLKHLSSHHSTPAIPLYHKPFAPLHRRNAPVEPIHVALSTLTPDTVPLNVVLSAALTLTKLRCL